VHGLLGRAALAVDGGAGDVLGSAGDQPTGAGDVARLTTDRVDVAEDDVLDRTRIDAGALQERLDGGGPEVGRVDLAQRATRGVAEIRPIALRAWLIIDPNTHDINHQPLGCMSNSLTASNRPHLLAVHCLRKGDHAASAQDFGAQDSPSYQIG
jgi:hypothetical protein